MTEAERELEKMLQGKDEEIDLTLANWLLVADIPEFSGMTRQEYLAQLDAMEKQVRSEMERMRGVALSRGKNLDDPDVRCSIFCNAVLKLKLVYREEFASTRLTPELLRGLYSDPNNLFLAGLIRTRRGSCVSMPLIYLVLGQRLGFPVNLVGVGRHTFIRWQEHNYRMNVETTIVQSVKVTPDDSVYIEQEGLRPDEIRGNVLRNMTRREVLGEAFYARAAYWRVNSEATKECYDISRARHLSPDDYNIERTHQLAFNHYRIKPHHKMLEITVNPKPK